MRNIAPIEAVEDSALKLSLEALHCRSFGRHDWIPTRVEESDEEKKLVVKCSHCTLEGFIKLDADYYIKGRPVIDTKTYPEGYLLTKGSGWVDRNGRAIYRRAYVAALPRRIKRKTRV